MHWYFGGNALKRFLSALGLTFQGSSSPLTDGEVEAILGEILDELQNQFGATLRE